MKLTTLAQIQELHKQNKLLGCFEISDELYHHKDCPGTSKSKLDEVDESIEYYAWRKENPRDQTDAMKIGSALHLKLLQPDEYNKTIYRGAEIGQFPEAIKDDVAGLKVECEKRNLDYKKHKKKDDLIKCLIEHQADVEKYFWSAYKEKFKEGKLVLTPAQTDKVQGMYDKLKSLPKAMKLLSGHYEKAFFWVDPETGLLCKCKPDSTHLTAKVLVDLKKARDVSPDGFTKSVYEFNYDVQNAFYLDGVAEAIKQGGHNGIEFEVPDRFLFVAIEEEAPYKHGYRALEDIQVEEGRSHYKFLLRKLKQAIDTDVWESPNAEKIITCVSKSYMYRRRI